MLPKATIVCLLEVLVINMYIMKVKKNLIIEYARDQAGSMNKIDGQ